MMLHDCQDTKRGTVWPIMIGQDKRDFWLVAVLDCFVSQPTILLYDRLSKFGRSNRGWYTRSRKLFSFGGGCQCFSFIALAYVLRKRPRWVAVSFAQP